MGKYKAHIKAGQSGEIADISSESTVVIGISVGSDVHENGKLQATLECLKEKGFKKFIFVIADTLQRYTLSLTNPKFDADDLADLADHLGDQWIQRNKDCIQEAIGNHYEIVKWKAITAMSYFKEWLGKLNGHIKEFSVPEGFNEAVDKTVQQFIERYKRQNSDSTIIESTLIMRAKQYVKEECAGLIGFGLDRKLDYFAYPNQLIPAFAFVQEKFLTFEANKAYLRYLSIGIKSVTPKQDNVISLFGHQHTIFAQQSQEKDSSGGTQTRANFITDAFKGMTLGFLSARDADVKKTQELFRALLRYDSDLIAAEEEKKDTSTSSTTISMTSTPVLS